MKEEEGKLACDDEAKEVESPEMAAAGLVDFVCGSCGWDLGSPVCVLVGLTV
jgi:hypothetical protein